MYGGSHLGAPPFYVYEKAPFGTLIEFLSDERNAPMFWRLFEQAAEGLKFLHRNDIAHGNLMCNNIMIFENFTVKLVNMGALWQDCDFGMTHREGNHVRPGDRWKPMEQLNDQADEAGDACEGDIYSLGMCMIEAITLEPPFGLNDDDTVRELILTGEGHPRPEDVSDEAWVLISEMCNPDLTRRPNIDVVIARIQELARHKDADKVLSMHIVPDDAPASKVHTVSVCAFASVSYGMWLGAPVALKKMSEVNLDHDQAFRQETNLWFKLRHPHIVSLFGICCGVYQLFVCDLVDGGSLDKYCFNLKGMSKEKVWGLLHDAAVGLQGLHSSGIVHADLKCNNILITKDGQAQLTDFGLSCLSTCDGGEPLGAPRWKAPECLNGAGPAYASDVYSFGMCIIEARTGQYPWGRHFDIAVVQYVKNRYLPARDNIFSVEEWELVRHMCRFNPPYRLPLDDVVKVLGYFAKRDPYVNDQSIRETLSGWA